VGDPQVSLIIQQKPNGGVDAAGDNHVTAKLSVTSPLVPLASNDLSYRVRLA
jgi:hypothetical protein